MSEKIAVHTPTKESYDRLMKAYKKKWWKRAGWQEATYFDFKSREYNLYHLFMDRFYSISEQLDYTIITVEEALARLCQYERGQEVLVSTNNIMWSKRIYLTTIEWACMPYYCVNESDNDAYRSWQKFDTARWEYIKPLEEPIKEMTMQEVETALGHKVKIVN